MAHARCHSARPDEWRRCDDRVVVVCGVWLPLSHRETLPWGSKMLEGRLWEDESWWDRTCGVLARLAPWRLCPLRDEVWQENELLLLRFNSWIWWQGLSSDRSSRETQMVFPLYIFKCCLLEFLNYHHDTNWPLSFITVCGKHLLMLGC